MKSYDVIVVGGGDAGLAIAFRASAKGMRVALLDKGSLGGTCVNTGCVPSKTLIAVADGVIESIRNQKLGIHSQIIDIDFPGIMERTSGIVANSVGLIKGFIEGSENVDYIQQEGSFVDEYTLRAGDETLRGEKIFIASGARPSIPSLKGLDGIPYYTNENILELKEKPPSMIFIGGGYVALEYAHFFSALGVKVGIIHRHKTFLPFAEPEVSELLKNEMGKKIELYLGFEPIEVGNGPSSYRISMKDVATGESKEISATAVFVSAGRKSNADVLKAENAGIELDKANFIKVDHYLRTNKKHIWALGDAVGRAMFTHAADREAELAWHNATEEKPIPMDFEAVPYAVYTQPQIASIGLTEQQARKGREILVGRANYSDTVMGEAIGEVDGFAKAVVEKATGKILGFHIIGPHAAILIQEVVNAVIQGGSVESLTDCMHIFPALSNIIPETLRNLK